VFVAPDDTEVKVAERDVGWILDRTQFDAFLAERAVALGAELLVSTEAAGMTCEPDGRWRVRLRGPGRSDVPGARRDRDGWRRGDGRPLGGSRDSVPARDMESCAQYVVEGSTSIRRYLSAVRRRHRAGWVRMALPKSPGVANVGLGLVALKADARNARQYLDEWIARRYPRGAKRTCTVGGVIAHTTIRRPIPTASWWRATRPT